jgi:Uma2 family endonuclease
MKAVMPVVPPEMLAWRKRTGVDKWDEMWEGVLHMGPAPTRKHQGIAGALETWLRTHWAEPNGNEVYHDVNVASIGGWPEHDYRIPDLLLLTPDRFHIDHEEYFEGAPTVVVEIRTPGDEAYEKLAFYAKIGVPEAWVIHRDTLVPELYELTEGQYQRRSPDHEGWLMSKLTGVEVRAEPEGRLGIRLTGDPSTHQALAAPRSRG